MFPSDILILMSKISPMPQAPGPIIQGQQQSLPTFQNPFQIGQGQGGQGGPSTGRKDLISNNISKAVNMYMGMRNKQQQDPNQPNQPTMPQYSQPLPTDMPVLQVRPPYGQDAPLMISPDIMDILGIGGGSGGGING